MCDIPYKPQKHVFSIWFSPLTSHMSPGLAQTLALPECHTIYKNTACGCESSTHKGEITPTAI